MTWGTLPELIFSDIMMMVGLQSLESLHRCRQVCKTWNEMIARVIWDSGNKKMILRERIQRNWGPGMLPSEEEISLAKMLVAGGILEPGHIQSLTERIRGALSIGDGDITVVKCGAALAFHGLLLGHVHRMSLRKVDVSEIPDQHLASLASCVTSFLQIENVIGGQQIVSLLTNLKCDGLSIDRQSLGREETQALVQAMLSGVRWVRLMEKVTLDVEALAEYSGQGVCREVRLLGDTAARYKEELRTWASNRNWRVIVDEDGMFKCKCNIDVITRIKNTFFRMLTNY